MTAIKLHPKQIKRFADFADEKPSLDGIKTHLDDILNTEIEVIGYRVSVSKYSKNNSGKYLTIQFVQDGARHIVFTGSDVLINQMEKYAAEIPFYATIKKIDRYYTLA